MKKTWINLGIAGLAAVEICLAWNVYLTDKVKAGIEDPADKIRILERAKFFNPLQDQTYYELGRAYFDRGVNSLADVGLRNDSFKKSAENFTRALSLNPASPFTHFDYAQSLLYQEAIGIAVKAGAYAEFQNAARLTGHNTQIFLEVGKVLLSRWDGLGGAEREYATQILQKVLEDRNREKLAAVLSLWDLHVRDYGVMDRILPRDSEILRLYAGFLGERSLDLSRRRKALAQAEALDFSAAKDELEEGERELQFFKIPEAFDRFSSCLSRLERIHFYSDSDSKDVIPFTEVQSLKRRAIFGQARCRLEETGKLEDAAPLIVSYMALEDDVGRLTDLESDLRSRGLLGDETVSGVKDFSKLSLQIFMKSKQNKFRDVVRIGEALNRSFLVVPDAVKKEYARVLEIIGDSYQKLDYVYESNGFYQKAMEIISGTPGFQQPPPPPGRSAAIATGGLGLLLRMRKNFERLNDLEQLKAINLLIKALVTPEETLFGDRRVPKGRDEVLPLVLEGGKIKMTLFLAGEKPGDVPLISVFAGGRVIWEGYLKGESISFEWEAVSGENVLRIVPVNRVIVLKKALLDSASLGRIFS